ncbi:MAG: hypothetical protein ACRD5W_01045 [Candidatus Acidiferrales bacterium]
MKVLRIVGLIVAVACFSSVSAVAQQEPPPLPVQNPQPPAQQTAGKVVNLSSTSLTVEVLESGATIPVDFAIDDNTQLDGRVAKDANVQVTYRIEEGRNVATLVMVVA